MDTRYPPIEEQRAPIVRRTHAILLWPWAGLIGLVALLAFVPLAPSMPSPGLDPSWAYALNIAVTRGLVFGRDIIFTFGPYASVYTGMYTPGTDRIMLAGSAVVAIGCAAGLITLAQPGRRLAALAVALCLGVVYPRDAIGFTLPILALLLMADAASKPGPAAPFAMLITLPGLAVLALVKESYTAAAGAALLCGLPALAARRRMPLAIGCLAVFGAALAALWVAAGQPLFARPSYFIGVLPIMSGYGQAMSIEASYELVALCTLGTLVMAVLPLPALRRRLGGSGLVICLGILLVLALSFKAGFLRGDAGHIAIVAGTLLLAGGSLSLVVPSRLSAVAWAVGIAIWLSIMPMVLPTTPLIAAERLADTLSFAAQGLLERIAHPANLDLIYQASLADMRARMPLPPATGPVDIYSFNQGSLIAAGLAWSPRPVLQSYSAYTPGLEALDRAHLLGPQAPETIFFRVEPIDARFPALEDGLSWPALLTRYRATALLADSGLAVLRRTSGEPEEAIGPPLATGRYALGQTVPLPPGDAPLWATIDLHPTWTGRLLDAAYRIPILAITLTGDDGSTQLFRYVPEMGQAGFLISPLVRTTEEFLALRGPGRRLVRPTSFHIDGRRFGWQDKFTVTLHALNIQQETKQ